MESKKLSGITCRLKQKACAEERHFHQQRLLLKCKSMKLRATLTA